MNGLQALMTSMCTTAFVALTMHSEASKEMIPKPCTSLYWRSCQYPGLLDSECVCIQKGKGRGGSPSKGGGVDSQHVNHHFRGLGHVLSGV